MKSNIAIIKGIHPGLIIDRELKKRKIPKNHFAISIKEYPQTLSSITKGKRNLPVSLALRIEKELDMEEGYLSQLQVFYEIKEEKIKNSTSYHPDLSKIRPVLFWDTDLKKLDWKKNKQFITKRIFERGNEEEIKELILFYGKDDILSVFKIEKNISPTSKKNLEKYISR